jgi:hypothetical protein
MSGTVVRSDIWGPWHTSYCLHPGYPLTSLTMCSRQTAALYDRNLGPPPRRRTFNAPEDERF